MSDAVNEERIRATVRTAIERLGVKTTSRHLGLSSEAICRLGGGIGVQTGTVYHAAANIKSLEELLAGAAKK